MISDINKENFTKTGSPYHEYLNAKQREWLQISVDDIVAKKVSLLQLVENLRPELIAREADIRADGINLLCALILALEQSSDDFQIDEGDCDYLLDYLLAKVEDSGHLANLLISTIDHLLTLHYGTGNKFLTNEQFDRLLTVLFENNGVQSYGKRDRIHLFTILEHLLQTHFRQVCDLGQQRFTMAFMQSAQGEREPIVLILVLKIHYKVASRLKLGVVTEDMFEMVACYFPLDYEPDPNNKGPFISREMLRHALYSTLLANPAFAPFCFQLVMEKLVDTDSADMVPGMGGTDSTALIGRQLEICELLTAACKKFGNKGLEQNLDDLATGIRLIFMNPSQNAQSLERSTRIISDTLQAMADSLTQSESTERNVADCNVIGQGNLRQFTEATIENIEPFILQAEMGTMGKAFRLLHCLANCNTIALDLVVSRALYWLHVLIDGQTLRSTKNREEIAFEALELLPDWLRLCIGMLPMGTLLKNPTTITGELKKETEDKLLTTTEESVKTSIIPLIAAVFALDSICAQKSKLLFCKCRTLSVLLLSICTNSPCDLPSVCHFRQCLQQNTHLMEFCQQTSQKIFLHHDGISMPASDGNVEKSCDAVKQFLTLYAICRPEIVQQFIGVNSALSQSENFNLLPTFIYPLPAELEGRELLTELNGKPNTISLYENILFKTLQPIITIDVKHDSTIAKLCTAAIVEISQRMMNFKNKQILFDQFLQPLIDFLERVDQMNEQFDYSRIDLLAVMLQDIGEQLHKNNDYSQLHTSICELSITRCCAEATGQILIRRCRLYWLLLLQCKSHEPLVRFVELLITLLNNKIKTEGRNDENLNNIKKKSIDDEWILEALFSTCFTLANRWNVNSISESPHDDDAISMDQTTTESHIRAFLNTNLFDTLTKALGESEAKFRLALLNVRIELFGKSGGCDLLKQLLENFLNLSEDYAQRFGRHLPDLLQFSLPFTNPDKCFYRTSQFWRQRILCQFVPIYIQCFHRLVEESRNERDKFCHCTSTDYCSRHFSIRIALLQLIGPLLELGTQIQPADVVLNEFAQLTPIIVEALPFVLATSCPVENNRLKLKAISTQATSTKNVDQQQLNTATTMGISSLSLFACLLDAIRLLLEKMPMMNTASFGTGSAASNESTQQKYFSTNIIHLIVQHLTKTIITSTESSQQCIPMEIQLKIFECLALIPVCYHSNANNTVEWKQCLGALYPHVVRSCSLMAAHRKRSVRQRVSSTRNAWELLMLLS